MQWTDPASTDYQQTAHAYAVEAVDLKTGNVSHLTPIRWFRTASQTQVLQADDPHHQDRQSVPGRHIEKWGKPADELRTEIFKPNGSGRYVIRVEFSNGSGPVNTGITCAVKKLELLDADSNETIASGYVVMPQSGDWKRWDLSSPVQVELSADKAYLIRIFEDEYCRNMSYLEKNERYPAWPGGGEKSYNFVNIATIRLERVANQAFLTRSN